MAITNIPFLRRIGHWLLFSGAHIHHPAVSRGFTPAPQKNLADQPRLPAALTGTATPRGRLAAAASSPSPVGTACRQPHQANSPPRLAGHPARDARPTPEGLGSTRRVTTSAGSPRLREGYPGPTSGNAEGLGSTRCWFSANQQIDPPARGGWPTSGNVESLDEEKCPARGRGQVQRRKPQPPKTTRIPDLVGGTKATCGRQYDTPYSTNEKAPPERGKSHQSPRREARRAT